MLSNTLSNTHTLKMSYQKVSYQKVSTLQKPSFYEKAKELVADKNITRNNNYKSRMCTNGANCPYGSKCRFAHSKDELRVVLCFYGTECTNVNCPHVHTSNTKEQEEYLKKIEEQKIKEEQRRKEEEEKRIQEEKKRQEEYEQTQKYWEDNTDKLIVNFDDSDEEDEMEEEEENEEKDEVDALTEKMEKTEIVDDELVQKTVISQIIHPKNEKNIKKYIMSHMALPEEGDHPRYQDKSKKNTIQLNLTNLEYDKLMFFMKYMNFEQK